MKKILVVVCLLVLVGCGGGGSEVAAPGLTQEQNDAIISGAQDAMDKINKPITDFCRDNPLSSLCIKGTADPPPEAYVGFVRGDFSGKTLYHVSLNTYTKVEYLADGKLRAYYPDQEIDYEVGAWTMSLGKLIVVTASTLDTYALYTLLSDDEANRYFKTNQQWKDGTTHTIGIFYDQTTGLEQAQAFVNSHSIP